MNEKTKQRIESDIKNNKVMLYMKGTPQEPQCGFSAQVMGVLNKYNVTVKTFNILEDEEIRQGIKEYSDWPTIPQLYVKGEFLGGSDIMMEMYEAGELHTLVAEKGITAKA